MMRQDGSDWTLLWRNRPGDLLDADDECAASGSIASSSDGAAVDVAALLGASWGRLRGSLILSGAVQGERLAEVR